MKPRAIQPITSLAMPAAKVSWPKLRRIRPISPRILAITGSDEIDNAVAMKSAKTSRLVSSPRNAAGMNQPTARPAAMGTRSEPAETAVAADPSRRIKPRSVSKPVATRRRSTPIQPTVNSMAVWASSSGKSHPVMSGEIRPRIDGPRTRPAASSPTTAGWPIRFMAMPKSFAVTKMTSSATQKTSS